MLSLIAFPFRHLASPRSSDQYALLLDKHIPIGHSHAQRNLYKKRQYLCIMMAKKEIDKVFEDLNLDSEKSREQYLFKTILDQSSKSEIKISQSNSSTETKD